MIARAALLLLALGVPAPGPAAADSLDQALLSVVSVLPEWPTDAKRQEEPEGSGVVVLDGRTILTAAHIVNKALSIRVRTSDGNIIPARLKGRDNATDLAVLTIDDDLPVLAIEEQDPALGDKVCAIGNAFGLGLSVTCGVVSGIHRAGVGFNRIEDFVQTDAAVNPGASGGALVNEEGKMVGLLSAIFTKKSDANIGVNFAVSAALARRVTLALRKQGRVVRAISGMRLEKAPALGSTGRLGARVSRIRPGSLAEKAGVRVDDVILRAGARRVRKPADFVSAMSGLTESGSLELELVRDGKTVKLRIAP